MLAPLLLALALAGDPDPQKIDCAAMKKQVVDGCQLGCEKQAKENKKNKEPPPPCGEMCDAVAKKMDASCKAMEKTKAKMKSAGGSQGSNEGGE